MKKQLPGWAVLLIITLIAGLALGGTYALTKQPIEEQEALAKENARKAVLPAADTFEEIHLAEGAGVDWAYAGLKDGAVVGYVAQKTVNGFGGKVEVIAGVDTTKAPDTFTIGGISVGGSGFSETAGLGAKSKEPAFTDQFVGKVYPVSFIKAGGEATDSTVDALTSATITTTAVVNGVNDIVKYVKADILGIAGVEMPAKPAGAQVYSASANGFRGPVYVEAAFDGNTVSYISVGDDSFAEDIGAGVREADFMIQFIGKEMPLDISDIDAISGATISSKAVVTALNTAYAQASGQEITEPEKPALPEKPESGVYSASEQGFAGPVYVEAAFDADGKVSYISVGDDQFAETQSFGARALEAEEQIPFIGAQMPLALDDVDALSGATYTKTAIVNGLNKAYAQATGTEVETVEPDAQTNATSSATQADAQTSAPDAETEPVDTAGEPAASGGEYAGEALSFFTAFRVETDFTALRVYEKAAGDAEYAPSENEAAYQQYFMDQSFPVDVESVSIPGVPVYQAQAVAAALNQAYEASRKDTAAAEPTEDAADEVLSYGKAISFFTQYTVIADIQGDALTGFRVLASPAGAVLSFNEEEELDVSALESQLVGQALPLDPADYGAVGGLRGDQVAAIIIALNQAYENPVYSLDSLAGQQ